MAFDGKRFPLESYARAAEAAGLLIEAIREPARVLDAGCGTGALASVLAEAVGAEGVAALDNVPLRRGHDGTAVLLGRRRVERGARRGNA